MKNTCLIFIWIIFYNTSYSQEDTLTPIYTKLFEKCCPIYVLDNYCSKTGLLEIFKAAKVDDRVSGIIREKETEVADSIIHIKYNSVVISFDKFKGVDYLGNFHIQFQNKEDMEIFSSCYKYLMGFIKDKTDRERYYSEKSPMNAITLNEIPDKKKFFLTCFVYQWGYCGK